MVTSLGDTLLAEQVRLVLRASGATDWTVRTDVFWCHAQPPGFRSPEQGWKLHVSATVLSAMLVTLRAAEVLVDSGCAFKVAMGLPQLRELLSASADRRSSGKVITAYPVNEAQFVALAEELHRATEHLPGPVILSDRPVRPGSLVHCRYGGFTGRRVLSNDGSFEPVLSVPGGGLVRDDRRVGVFAPPWAPCPLRAEPPRAAGSASAQPTSKPGQPAGHPGRHGQTHRPGIHGRAGHPGRHRGHTSSWTAAGTSTPGSASAWPACSSSCCACATAAHGPS